MSECRLPPLDEKQKALLFVETKEVKVLADRSDCRCMWVLAPIAITATYLALGFVFLRYSRRIAELNRWLVKPLGPRVSEGVHRSMSWAYRALAVSTTPFVLVGSLWENRPSEAGWAWDRGSTALLVPSGSRGTRRFSSRLYEEGPAVN
jgi:hypothetical protein